MNNGTKFRCNVLSCATYTIPFHMCGDGKPFGRVGEGGRGIKERRKGEGGRRKGKGGGKKEGGGKKGEGEKVPLSNPT